MRAYHRSHPKVSTFLIAVILLSCIGFSTLVPFVRVNAGAVSRRAVPAAAQPKAKAPSRKGEVLIRFRAGVSQTDKDVALANHQSRVKKQLRGESAIEKLGISETEDANTVASQLSLNPAIEFAEPNFIINKDQLSGVTPNDPSFAAQWALSNTGQNNGQYGSDIDVSKAWQTTTGGQGTVIAIIDSGVDFTHPDLVNNEWTNPSPANGDTHGWDYVTDSAAIRDEFGHGTAIAGIIAAQGNNGLGVSGVMWRASLMSLRVLDNTGSGDISSAVEAIDYAVAHNAQVINLSWGTAGESAALKDAIERANRRGVVVVCSAGNTSQDVDAAPYYPASFGIRDVLSVAGSDNFDRLASWSNWGNQSISLAAPGDNVLTTKIGGGYANVSGTSAAAPLVTGIAGLIKSANYSLNPHAVAKAITSGVRQVASLRGKVSSGGVASASGAIDQVHGSPNQSSPVPTPNYGGNSSSNGQGGNSNLPPTLRPDGQERRANGKDGLHVTAPNPIKGAPLANLPDLAQSRKIRKSPATSNTTAPIHADLMCTDCDPGGGGGAGGSDPYFGTARTRPINRTGGTGVTLGSRNFNWSAPLVSLPGRAGMDLSVALFYNSLVWTQQGSAIQYNADHGTPAPGFQIGLPRLQTQYYNSDASVYAYTMITPSGARVEMRQVGGSSVYESSDSTYTQLTFSGSTPVVRATDGTQYIFGTAVSGEWRCTTIEDRNGNYISATYNTSNGHILTITDTLGRVLNFNYDGDNNLASITQTWGGATHTWVSFYYSQVYMSFNFSGLTPVGASSGSYQTVLSYIVFPESTAYIFDYNSYGQVYKIRHNAPDGHELEHTLYTINTAGALTDCPRFTDRRDYAEDWNGGTEAITYYSVTNGAFWTNPETAASNTGTMVEQTAPDGTSYREYSHASGWDTGLTRLNEFWSGGYRKKWSSTNWTQDNTGLSYPQNPRVAEANIYDDGGNRRRTTVDYTSYGLPSAVQEWIGSAGNSLYRTTTTAYRFDGVFWIAALSGSSIPSKRRMDQGR